MNFLDNTLTNPTGCLEWQGSRNQKGYARYGGFIKGKTNLVHKLVLEELYGPPPEGQEALHLCHNPPCINPDHLEYNTHTENMRQLFESRTHCKNGHPITEDNIYRYGNFRKCRRCHLERDRAYAAKRRANV